MLRIVAATMLLTANANAGLAPDVLADWPKYQDLRISPTGKYLAAVVPFDGEEKVVILNREQNKVSALAEFRGDEVVNGITWAKDDRLLVTNAVKRGGYDAQVSYGELFAIDADGGNARNIFGYRAGGSGTGTHLKTVQATYGSHRIVSKLYDDENFIRVAVYPWTQSADGSRPYLAKLNINNGKMFREYNGPMLNSRMIADHSGNVRFAAGEGMDGKWRVYLRDVDNREWLALDDINSDSEMYPITFTADNKNAYLLEKPTNGYQSLYLFNFETKEKSLVYAPQSFDLKLSDIAWSASFTEPLFVNHFLNDETYIYLNADHPLSKMHRALVKSLKTNIDFTSYSRDGKFAIARSWSDQEPGAYYLVDLTNKKVDFIAAHYETIEPEKMAKMQAHNITARDGMTIPILLTLPPTKTDALPPLIVMPHGGPHGIYDAWGFNNEVQFFASHGYAVLQVNFRGSGGYGTAFEEAGYREWGRKIQDDITDATLWAIKEKWVSKDRICIAGGSFGGYASMMGLVREPALYRCGVTDAGVSDLAMMFEEGDIPERKTGKLYLKKVLGEDSDYFKQYSPLTRAADIQVPVMIIHGGKDERVPIIHAEKLEEALKNLNKPVETLYYDNEMHGFANKDHKAERYRRMLAFFEKHIGNKAASAQ